MVLNMHSPFIDSKRCDRNQQVFKNCSEGKYRPSFCCSLKGPLRTPPSTKYCFIKKQAKY
ncbi:hypothetical protein GALMADRAFT_218486 [Galerina marginata CBS 339.88]|uniref:Uncharacterized protein n=1 Tax=Galerina marginata (strain CBS 339.88) TaxID=685588 RepID=A0A067TSU7_GALM3|nr:hypothetical protein GALMADRAFT_218486 [Galerina marginata CBS 339.88]